MEARLILRWGGAMCLLLLLSLAKAQSSSDEMLPATTGRWERPLLLLPLDNHASPQVRLQPSVVFKPAPMPLFCRIEHRWSQRVGLPLKFRLGSVPYVDWLEGKRRGYE